MTAQLALGTYRCQRIPEAAARAAASGVQWIDTAPNYATGRAQDLLAPALAAHTSLRIRDESRLLHRGHRCRRCEHRCPHRGPDGDRAQPAPDYVRRQTRRNRKRLGRERLDLVLLHNPERVHPSDGPALHRAIRDAFIVLEGEAGAGVQFEADGPAVEGEWALPKTAQDRYTEWGELYTKDPKVVVRLIEKTGSQERVLRTWTAQGETTP